MPITRKTLIALVILLLIQLFIRAHNITKLPVFVDEFSHIRRAAVVYDFEKHPAIESHGKFLFYFLPGIFDLKDNDTALHLARTSVALASLLITAIIFLICRSLFDERAGLLGAAFYVFVPYAFFFERMALSDPWAGLMAAINVWMAIRFARKPDLRRALWLGTFMAFTLAAKLTMSFTVTIPAFTILLLGEYHSLRDIWQRYGKGSIVTILTVGAWWSLVLIPAAIQFEDGVKYAIYDNWLADPTAESGTLLDKLDQWWEKMELLVSVPMTLLWFILIAILIWKAPRRGGILLLWLLLAWFPSFFIVANGSFQSRYLMAGAPAIAALFGAGMITAADWVMQRLGADGIHAVPTQQTKVGTRSMRNEVSPASPSYSHQMRSFGLATVVFLLWLIVFALPFARNAMTDPTKLEMPPQDEKDYFGGWFNGYGIIESLTFLQQNGEQHDGKVYTLLHTRFCIPPFYGFHDIDYLCNRYLDEADNANWRNLVIRPLEEGQAVYIVSDRFYEPLEDERLNWEELAVFAKPKSGALIKVWQITLNS